MSWRATVGVGRLGRGLDSTPRRHWWVTFTLLSAIGAIWALANAPLAAPDEALHVIRAAGVARGQVVGEPLTRSQADDLAFGTGGREGGPRSAYRAVDIPAIYGGANWGCFAFRPDKSAACLRFEGSDEIRPVVGAVQRYPPAYHAWVGAFALPLTPGPQAMYGMRFGTIIVMAALLASAAATIRAHTRSRFGNVALLVALTPMTLFLSASVNPSGPEIAAAIALWVSGLFLVTIPPDRIDRRLVSRVGIAAAVLIVARPLGPVWLALIAASILALARRDSLRGLLRRRSAVVWGAIVAALTAMSITWLVIEKPLAREHTVFGPADEPISRLVRTAFGNSYWYYRQMIGLFGWLDTPSPTLTILIWTAVLGALLALAVAVAPRRRLIVLGCVLGASFALPIVIDVFSARSNGQLLYWQGRYGLPIAVGVPILAAFSVPSARVAWPTFRLRLIATLGVALVVAQVLAFAQNLRRYTVALDGPIQYWLHPLWSPPLPAWFLTLAFAIAIAATTWWFLRAPGRQPAEVGE